MRGTHLVALALSVSAASALGLSCSSSEESPGASGSGSGGTGGASSGGSSGSGGGTASGGSPGSGGGAGNATGGSAGTASGGSAGTSSGGAAGGGTGGAGTGGGVTLIGAGDIADCGVLTAIGQDGHQKTAALVQTYPAATPVFTAGDNAYPDGTALNFSLCYALSWGLFKDRTYPSAGNHDYNTAGAEAYFDYFGARAGEKGKGYYSYELGDWHVVVLNSNCTDAGPGFCAASSAQMTWLKQDLAASTKKCTLAYWHHPLFTSDQPADNDAVRPLYQALYDAGADLAIVGHSHHYERFPKLDPQGNPDPAKGIRQLVVGTGGAKLREPDHPTHPRSELLDYSTHGIIELALHAGGYSWKLVPVAGGSFTDSGSESCH